MKVLVTGASGFLGTTLRRVLSEEGWEVGSLARSGDSSNGPFWDPEAGVVRLGSLEDAVAVIHLAGENLAAGRWTVEKKERIRRSRVEGTRLLAEHLASLAIKPKVLVSASAIGIYGNQGGRLLDETSAPGSDFLAGVCREWEESTRPALEAGIRVVNARIGMILSPEGGALAKMLPLFRWGLGGRLGKGRQFMSWASLEDLGAMFSFALTHEEIAGPVNFVSPNPVPNWEFTKTMGKVLGRPALFPAPEWALRAAMGEMADGLLLSSARVTPRKLLEAGFAFRHPELEMALREMLKQ